MTVDQMRSLQPALAALLGRFRGCFRTAPTFAHLEHYVLGLMSDLKRKSIEPIALAAGAAVRTLQEFLAFLAWDDERAGDVLQRRVADEHQSSRAIGIIDASGHFKQGQKTPGVKRQYCGERGKIDNCVVGQHLLYTDNYKNNPFVCMLASDLYLPQEWASDAARRREAKIPEELTYRPKWRIAVDQVEHAIGNGVRFAWLTFDEEYGSVPSFWFELDRLGQWGIGEVRKNFPCWPTLPHYQSQQRAHAAKRVDNVYRWSPMFRDQPWQRVHITRSTKQFTYTVSPALQDNGLEMRSCKLLFSPVNSIKKTTRGPSVWEVKSGRVHLVDASETRSRPTDRLYWLIVARNPDTQEIKYFVSNAPAAAKLKEMLDAAFARWHVEKWFERAKQEAGLGAFEVRTYRSLIRHWFCCRLAMYFLATQTQRLRGEKSEDHPGASGGSGQRFGIGDLEERLAHAG